MKYPEFLSPYVFGYNIPVLNMFRWYGLMYIAGMVASYFILQYSQKQGFFKLNVIDKKSKGKAQGGDTYDLIFYMALGAVLGARIGYFILYSPATFLRPWEILGLNFDNGIQFYGFAGMSFHGGWIGTMIAAFLFAKKYNFKYYYIADNVVLPLSMCLFFGRLGNFLNAELYGRETTSILGMRFPMYDAVGGYEKWISLYKELRPYTEPRYPSQLFEAILEGLVLAFIMLILSKNHTKIKDGTRLWVWILLYGVFRFSVEFVREISEWTLGVLTSGMIYSLPMIVIGGGMLIYIYFIEPKNKKEKVK